MDRRSFLALIARLCFAVGLVGTIHLVKRGTYGDAPLPDPFSYVFAVIVGTLAMLVAYKVIRDEA